MVNMNIYFERERETLGPTKQIKKIKFISEWDICPKADLGCIHAKDEDIFEGLCTKEPMFKHCNGEDVLIKSFLKYK